MGSSHRLSLRAASSWHPRHTGWNSVCHADHHFRENSTSSVRSLGGGISDNSAIRAAFARAAEAARGTTASGWEEWSRLRLTTSLLNSRNTGAVIICSLVEFGSKLSVAVDGTTRSTPFVGWTFACDRGWDERALGSSLPPSTVSSLRASI
ncbi:hypothetical protein BJY01DRAFT_213840 [Aspergillus pseudoustus]|uniref:Uncharacterized protein n=1 Tax=Aspergillus pseudoustus TaxID=1810923 RepID=A0ABR4K0S5_9EURO